MKFLHGIHDPGGEHLMNQRPGWFVVTEEVGTNAGAKGGNYTPLSEQGHGVIVRLNYSHQGQGTIPLPDQYAAFAQACANFAATSQGQVAYWMIGNEPNHEGERPGGHIISPEDYARCYLLVREAILSRKPGAKFMHAAMAPYHANPISWTEYLVRVFIYILHKAGHEAIDALNCHAYGRSMDPATITSEEKMGGVLLNQYRSFRTYRDFALAVAPPFKRKPAFITEFDVNVAWEDRDTGVITAAYEEIDRWNQSEEEPKFQALVCFRWWAGLNHVDWGMENKPRLLDDFKRAVWWEFRAAEVVAGTNQSNEVRLPFVGTGDPPAGPAEPPVTPTNRHITERFMARTKHGVDFLDQPLEGRSYYRLIEADYYPTPEGAQKFGPDHHILVEVLDQQGNRKMGQPVHCVTNDTDERKPVDKQAGPYGVDFPMFKAGYGYSVFVGDDPMVSERAYNMGLGTIEQPDWNHHVTYFLTFQEYVKQIDTPVSELETGKPEEQMAVPRLLHPLGDSPWGSRITRTFGTVSDDYAGLNIAGHTGIDFGAPFGTPVFAVAEGQVLQASFMADYGNVVKLGHPWGETVYAHLSEMKVRVGEYVKAGQELGLIGSTGNSTGNHLHFGLRRLPYQRGYPYDGYSDPAPYIPARFGPVPEVPPGTPSGPEVSKAAIVNIIHAAAEEFSVDPALLLSLIHAESSLNHFATNAASGAMGLGQIIPATWAEIAPKIGAVNPYDARDNARVTAYYLAWCIKQAGSERKGLWAYVWGIGNVQAGRTPPLEVIGYATKIIHGKEVLQWGII